MNNLLMPDMNNSILRKYHISSKLLIAGLLSSYILNKNENKLGGSLVNSLNILNIGFHSYVSTSCIITDYIKPPKISTIVRYGSLNAHILACMGYIYYNIKKND